MLLTSRTEALVFINWVLLTLHLAFLTPIQIYSIKTSGICISCFRYFCQMYYFVVVQSEHQLTCRTPPGTFFFTLPASPPPMLENIRDLEFCKCIVRLLVSCKPTGIFPGFVSFSSLVIGSGRPCWAHPGEEFSRHRS